MGRIGTTELVLILVVLLLLFGAKRIPEIARSIGKSMNQFKKGLKDVDINSEEENKDHDDKIEQNGE
ncbi:MAG: twin-arginine translocase TatA/TatE family subunit [Candidatus Fermentibacteria bacterium]|nr:twin-arginine translocase TatA/TatE family subunit [Candidatus Fermentibacteria bacterium]